MLGYAVIGMLAAFGLLCALWVSFGALLPGSGKTVIYCICAKENAPAVHRRWRWLRELGLIRGRMVILCDGKRARECIERELKQLDTAGNADPSGHDRRRDLSEL